MSISSTSQEKLDKFVPSLEIAKGHLLTSVVDVTKEGQVKDLIAKTVEHYGSLDVLVPNAGDEGKALSIQE